MDIPRPPPPPSSPSLSSSSSSPSQSFLNLNRNSWVQILTQAVSVLYSNFLTFLVLSLLLFSLRAAMESGSLFITSVVDRDPALKSLLSNFDISGKSVRSIDGVPSDSTPNRRRGRPFLQINRIGAIEDDFPFSDDADFSLFGIKEKKTYGNGSFTELGFRNVAKQRETRISHIVRPGFLFRAEFNDVGEDDERRNNSFELDREEVASLFFLFLSMTASYACIIVYYVLVYSSVLGVVFVASARDILEKNSSFLKNMFEGGKLGLNKLAAFVLMTWAVRDSITQILGVWFFGGMEDAYSFFRLFVRMKMMPFSSTPRLRRFHKDISEFLTALFIAETCMDFFISFLPWVAVLDSNLAGREIVVEGCLLLSTVVIQGMVMKSFECLLCGRFVRSVLVGGGGEVLVSMLQSVADVYFKVVWMMLYISARWKEARKGGRGFEEREFENVLEDVR